MSLCRLYNENFYIGNHIQNSGNLIVYKDTKLIAQTQPMLSQELVELLPCFGNKKWRYHTARSGKKYFITKHTIDHEKHGRLNAFEIERDPVLDHENEHNHILTGLFSRKETSVNLMQNLCNELQFVSGFSRVMIYIFDPKKKNGRVAAEALLPESGSVPYKNMHFPDMDIPDSVKKLYKKYPFRGVNDINSNDKPLVFVDDVEPFDLDMRPLYYRPLATLHQKYLKNMNVHSSYSFSIMLQDDLYGLLCFHNHKQKKSMSSIMRGISFNCTEALSLRLEMEMVSGLFEQTSILRNLKKDNLITLTKTILSKVGRWVNADFAMLKLNTDNEYEKGQNITHDNKEQIDAYCEWATTKEASEIVICDCLDDLTGLHSSEFMAGVFHIPLTEESYIAWFKKETKRQDRWVVSANDEIFEPRKNFQSVMKDVIHECEPWSIVHKESVVAIQSVIREAIEQTESNNQVNSLIASASHQLRTPLFTMSSVFDSLENSGALDSDQLDIIHDAVEANAMLTKMINQMIILGDVETGVSELVTFNYVEQIKLMLKRKSFSEPTFDFDKEQRDIYHNGDLAKWKIVVGQLFQNAEQYAPNDKFSIKASTLSDNTIVVVVSNQGKFPKKSFKNITRRYKLNNELPEIAHTKSLGLGLYIARKSCEKINATLDLISEEPVVISFQTKMQMTDKEKVGKRIVTSNKPIYKILLIEDNLILQKILRAQLMKKGYQIVTADDGEQAVQLYEYGESFNLIITDLNMPHKDGVETSKDFRQIEKSSNKKRAPIVAFSAAHIRDEDEFCRKNDMDAFIQKPCHINDLDNALLKIIEKNENEN